MYVEINLCINVCVCVYISVCVCVCVCVCLFLCAIETVYLNISGQCSWNSMLSIHVNKLQIHKPLSYTKG